MSDERRPLLTPVSVAQFGPLVVRVGERFVDSIEVAIEPEEGPALRSHVRVAQEVLEVRGRAPSALALEYLEARTQRGGEAWLEGPLHGARATVREGPGGTEVAGVEGAALTALADEWRVLSKHEPVRAAVDGQAYELRVHAPPVARAVAELLTRGAGDASALFEAKLHHVEGPIAVFEVTGQEQRRWREATGPRASSFILAGALSVLLQPCQLVELSLEGPGTLDGVGGIKSVRWRRRRV